MSGVSGAPIEDLLATYAAMASTHGRATEAGDNDAANSAHEELVATYRELRARGADTLRGLLPFLGSRDAGIRLWAAAHSLDFAPGEAEPVLVELAAKPKSLVAFSAEIVLKEWRAGALRFP